MGIEYYIVAAVVVSAAKTIYSTETSNAASDRASRRSEAMYGQQRADLERAKQEELARQKAEEERLKPWREAQTSALEKYRQMAENPEVSDYTRLRLEEEEKAINKELAAKGLLFSGPAAELRQKARERIIAEETESAKGMLANVMNAAPPGQGLMPGTAQYDALIAGLQPKSFGTSGTSGQGALGVGASILGGAQSYLTYKGSQDATEAYKQRTQGLYNYPLSLYGQGGGQGVGLMSSYETGLPIY